ncbi:hypothetical protein CN616_27410 [Bacillus toyonensis]|nr:hypothetical protein CN616_27410 [Bacillus toyonensis]
MYGYIIFNFYLNPIAFYYTHSYTSECKQHVDLLEVNSLMMKSLYRILELEKDEISSSEKLVLLTIAIYSNDKFIPFSITELENYTNLSRATVTRLVKQLEEKGFIEVQRNGTATNSYKVTL